MICTNCGEPFAAPRGEFPSLCPQCLADAVGPTTFPMQPAPGLPSQQVESRTDAPIVLDARGRGDYRATAEVLGDVVRIRVDDDRDDAFWLELTITREQLEQLIAGMQR